MPENVILDRTGLTKLIAALREDDYDVIGPVPVGGAIEYRSISQAEDLPMGWRDVQEAGQYRLEPRDDDALFGFVHGPQSWKAHLHPPKAKVWEGTRDSTGVTNTTTFETRRMAFFGVRPCELAAIAIQDRVLLEGPIQDDTYASRRADLFLVAVNCTEPGGTCFCTSLGTGPGASDGFDLSLTEIEPGIRFVVTAGSEQGAALLATLDSDTASEADLHKATTMIDTAAERMGRVMDTSGMKELLQANIVNEHWETVAARCLTCQNCTMVCPTCFCTSVDDELSLDGSVATRTRRWDSCFSIDFSYIHGGAVRSSPASRYRQWMTHKLASWQDQFGDIGCVGCGRCITWCPVGIDITAELRAIASSDVRETALLDPLHSEEVRT